MPSDPAQAVGGENDHPRTRTLTLRSLAYTSSTLRTANLAAPTRSTPEPLLQISNCKGHLLPTPALSPPRGPSSPPSPNPCSRRTSNVRSVFLTSCYLACPKYLRPRSPPPPPAPRPAWPGPQLVSAPPSCLLLKFFSWVSAPAVRLRSQFCLLFISAGSRPLDPWPGRQGGDEWGTRP